MQRLIAMAIGTAAMLAGVSLLVQPCALAGPEDLTPAEMEALVGTARPPCYNCHAAGGTFDECAHAIVPQPTCQPNLCIHNVVVSDTCDHGIEEDCTGRYSPSYPSIMQETYTFTGCTWEDNQWHLYKYLWFSDDCPCQAVAIALSCKMTNGPCSDEGDPETRTFRGNGVKCVE